LIVSHLFSPTNSCKQNLARQQFIDALVGNIAKSFRNGKVAGLASSDFLLGRSGLAAKVVQRFLTSGERDKCASGPRSSPESELILSGVLWMR
ncbi:MAG TPA: hypothetical protein VIG36_02795, partial [Methylocystis sp.]